ncbi:uncharacterized protein CcaverHIS019_0210290 [Cutaneotrichosporon cavernicola]|uniref:ENTH domain-containing protein n=1 Tax=Cutaneotrichosporon cavernicola TaxID=279322 RepID=A0AA48I5G0_9TREE|nr:uncharacterized protein CcaverHIS019_0210290 [Cutaneotrichosporon cavernicola]BEI89667.1 hypothetical protein CcaverHIS019_0210290 [Cutaneotrichosporon cavernicola]BEI97438.1 hypothetical protein CcaverHIS631_0210270 [Cutaneotrichosporon cavernicola]BEJ05216.1 hypothetical protein CcaverHIS641_0210330 [Cutaneotrichosporon cavernicola]
MAQSLQHFGRGALRVAKNYTKGYSDTQTKVRDATSNDPWGPSGTQMNEIAQLTYNQGDFVEIMEMLDKRLNDKGKNWRHVFKALTVLDYCLHAGSENVVVYFKDNLYIVKTLKEFVYVDDQGKDVGHNVRQKAKDITNLLQDEERLRTERRQRGAMRDRMLGNIADSGLQGEEDLGDRRNGNAPRRQRPANYRNPSREEDDDLQRALQESMDTSREEDKRRSQRVKEEDDLQKALRLSEEDEARKKREAEEANQRALMDDNFQLESNNQYSQQNQQGMGMMNTGFPLVDTSTGWGGQQQLQPQFTSYNPFYAQMLAQQQQQQQQQQMMQQQEMMQQQQMLEQQRQQEEYMRQQMMLQQQQSLIPQHTSVGSNNPFAPRPQQQSLLDQGSSNQNQNNSLFSNSFLPVPSVQTQLPQQPTSPVQSPVSATPVSPAKPAWQAPVDKDDGQHAHLANLLSAGREGGTDTFGNVGNLRFGANNPFGGMGSQKTGMPQQQKPNDQPFFQI